MKKVVFILLFAFFSLIAFPQNNRYSIFVSFYKFNKLKKAYTRNYNKNRMSKYYTILLINNDSVYTIIPNEYYRFNYENNNLKLIIKRKNTNTIVLEMDSLEQFYIFDNSTIYVYIGINEKAKPTSIAGAFYSSDYSEDNFCIDCIENMNHLVVIECSEGEFDFKKRRDVFKKKLFNK